MAATRKLPRAASRFVDNDDLDALYHETQDAEADARDWYRAYSRIGEGCGQARRMPGAD